MEYRDKIIDLARRAPLLPIAVAKALNTDSIMAGAMLSEMCGRGLLKPSTLKIGGSPLYYIPGNQEQLLNHLESLNEKDRKTVLKLKEEKIIRDKEATPLIQVSLRAIKDFARPLTVTYEGTQETFWKWFSITDKEAEDIIRAKLKPTEQKIEPTHEVQQPLQPKTEFKKEVVPPKPVPKPAAKPTPKPAKPDSDFWRTTEVFFTQNNIALLEKTAVKKKIEFDLLVELPSPVGKLTYFCKVRSKKRISDADISAAYVQGQLKKLPVLFLTDGQLTKKAQELITQLRGITVKQI